MAGQPRPDEFLPGFDGPVRGAHTPDYDQLRPPPRDSGPDPMLAASSRRLLRMALIGGSWHSPWWRVTGGRRGGLIYTLFTAAIAGFVALLCFSALSSQQGPMFGPLFGLALALALLGSAVYEGWYALRILAVLRSRRRR